MIPPTSMPASESPRIHDKEKPDIAHIEAAPTPTPTPTFPDGGLRAWSIVAGSFLVQFCGFGYLTSFGVYQDYYTRIYLTKSSPAAISWIGSANIFIVTAGGLLVGRLYDKGYFYHLTWGGAVIMSLSLFLLSLVRQEHYSEVFVVQGVLYGLGAGMMYVPSVAIVGQYFYRQRAKAMTILAAGSSLGAVVHPIMLNHLLHSSIGFGNAVRASAVLVSALLLAASSLLRTRLAPSPQPSFLRSFQQFASDIPFIALSLGLFFLTVGFWFPLYYLQLDAVSHGVRQPLAFYVLVLMSASSFVGRLAPAPLTTRVRVDSMLVIACAGVTVSVLGMLGLRGPGSAVALAVTNGFFGGTFITLLPPAVALLTGKPSELGIGIAFSLEGIGALAGPPVLGALLTPRLIWWRTAVFSTTMSVIGTLLMAYMHLLNSRRRSPAAPA